MTSSAVDPNQARASAPQEDLLIVQLLRAVPIVGWFISDAIDGKPDAKYYFLFNLAVLVAVAIAFFGYAALIILALAATAISFIAILVITAG